VPPHRDRSSSSRLRRRVGADRSTSGCLTPWRARPVSASSAATMVTAGLSGGAHQRVSPWPPRPRWWWPASGRPPRCSRRRSFRQYDIEGAGLIRRSRSWPCSSAWDRRSTSRASSPVRIFFRAFPGPAA
jgi:hypothetical protein